MDRDYWINRPKFYNPFSTCVIEQVAQDWWNYFGAFGAYASEYSICGA